ncbi:SIS domain-containing protein [Acidiplasma cupricumulans]|uniref:Glucosamine 6-phosphate synthase n=1 Tax=Acidiplasma cupricumulans TaxID=312540 RepID=A0A0Q0RY24_9ARCH|nr:SIS domain-containing protein [Acidiplasma cupricumulans]KQB34960.1 glucosamine 6-phosphate synthase [Acidiplasma cupricumulans]
MTDEIPEKRNKHPYFMYDMIKDIPNGLNETVREMEKFDYDIIKSPLVFTGNGTAYHSEYIGSQFLNKLDVNYRVIQAYELLNYSGLSKGTVIGISHSGKTKSTMDALSYMKKYAFTVGITHYENTTIGNITDKTVIIKSPDLSLCNTKAFFDNAIASMYIAQNYAGIDVGIKEIIKKIINLVSDMEKPVMDIAGQLNDINTIFVLGSGPNYPVARESAQKIKEATHIHAEGIELEEFNHGCTSIIDDKSLLILIGDGYNNERMNQIVRACRVTGTKTLTLNGSGDFNINIDGFNDIYLNPVLNIVPLYYLAYFMAVQRHINPDLLRFDEKKYLEFDNIIFPPGAH